METCVSRSTCKKCCSWCLPSADFSTDWSPWSKALLWTISSLSGPKPPDAVFAKLSSGLRLFWAPLKWSCISPEIGFKFQADVLLPEQSFILGCFCFETSIISSFLATHEETAARQAPSSLIDLVSSTTSNNFQHKINSAILRDAVTGLPDAHPSLIVYVETIHNSVPQAFQVLSRTCFRKKKK